MTNRKTGKSASDEIVMTVVTLSEIERKIILKSKAVIR